MQRAAVILYGSSILFKAVADTSVTPAQQVQSDEDQLLIALNTDEPQLSNNTVAAAVVVELGEPSHAALELYGIMGSRECFIFSDQFCWTLQKKLSMKDG